MHGSLGSATIPETPILRDNRGDAPLVAGQSGAVTPGIPASGSPIIPMLVIGAGVIGIWWFIKRKKK